ncbi:hypothetical protein MHAS_01157 [Mycolicibacterium hassiacum DSM 44199]|uniref:hypothetical protein n=1 Tax=Mycolicibacterium hassiacum TaxID=46351 RepID=UPI0003628915|nr:hypothetical protein [Mycolicibacterium hassiacum]ARQ94666.1 head-to-tail connector protein [Mycobacterium phage Journey13]MDA4086007.1 hypothetical protein [Mycolicibacterium hassiacum DSM 44199]VCT89464.1 hypothetical protein MHAS_01157 [Mycolicibacterium hassiacum DSM 44199]
MSGSDAHRAPIIYPPGFLVATTPDRVNAYDCDHDIGLCRCVHDWRIEWGNVKKATQQSRSAVI